MKKSFLFLFILIPIAFTLSFTGKTTPEQDLFEAIRLKNVKKTAKILKKEINVNAVNQQGQTVLHYFFHSWPSYSFDSDQEQVLNLLIKKGFDVNAEEKTEYKNTVLTSCILTQNHLKPMEMLIDAGADIRKDYLLHLACFKRKSNYVTLLVDKGIDVNAKKNGETPLQLLLKYADLNKSTLKILEFLHKKGADIFVRDRQGYSLLDYCVNNKNKDCADYLRKQGVKEYNKPIYNNPSNSSNKIDLSMSRDYYGVINGVDVEMSASVNNEYITLYYKIYYSEYNIDKKTDYYEIVSSKYTSIEDIPAVEYYVNDQRGGSGYIYFLEMPGDTDGYNRIVVADADGMYVLDAEW
ncbi:MAG: ankyrin repeat domain-containing protein [Weeksellaceae bacterium]|jgi:hypothetical protein|nr:ankyrin repeat domain-containing protein [Weeksellaceae bacterium]